MPDRRGSQTGRRRSRDRAIDFQEVQPKILIVCEGERTEPNYFKAFRVASAVMDIRGIGDNTVFLVRQAMLVKENDGPFDQVWCVFDRDSFPVDYFNQALTLAKSNNIEVAYSNEAFELWYVLHFEYLDTGISRQQYRQKLTELLHRRYEKNDLALYAELLPRQPDALRNARRLLAQYEPCNPAQDKPTTTVHLLVEELNRFLP